MSTLTTTIKALRKFFEFRLKRQLHLCSKVQVQVHLFTFIQLQYNNKEKKEVKNRANYTLN